MKKLAAIIAAVGLSLCSLTGCAQSGVKNSVQATAKNSLMTNLPYSTESIISRSFLTPGYCVQ
jgi:hypothetical protein